MTNPNIPPEIADERLSDDDLRDIAENGCFSAPAMAKEIIAFRSAPAPVRISPEVRETILRALRMVLSQDESRARWVECRQDYAELVGRIDTGKAAIAFVEALP